MKIDINDPIGRITKIVDFVGKTIPLVKSFDTETKEAELYLMTSQEGSRKGILIVSVDASELLGTALLAKIILPGCKAINKETGEEIK